MFAGRVRFRVLNLQRMQGGQTELSCFVNGLYRTQQQGFEVYRPLQALFFCQERQLAHHMHQTEGMRIRP
jgi:hypothetical protein